MVFNKLCHIHFGSTLAVNTDNDSTRRLFLLLLLDHLARTKYNSNILISDLGKYLKWPKSFGSELDIFLFLPQN